MMNTQHKMKECCEKWIPLKTAERLDIRYENSSTWADPRVFEFCPECGGKLHLIKCSDCRHDEAGECVHRRNLVRSTTLGVITTANSQEALNGNGECGWWEAK